MTFATNKLTKSGTNNNISLGTHLLIILIQILLPEYGTNSLIFHF